jgi:radical SAM protein with 4Fe4S-binding SPASM domain
MSATASWNAHSAPDAEDWFIARRDIFEEIAARRGRIMEHNLAHAIPKFVRTLLNDVSPFNTGCGCWDMRCPAGEQLMYFDQKGNAYPCPRANVTAEASIGHYAAEDFERLWDEKLQQLDAAMTTAPECKQCPAQFVCDYGCHAFNVGPGNFFEVNCDGTKDYYQWITAHLEDVARIFFYVARRAQLKARDIDAYTSLRQGMDMLPDVVSNLAEQIRQRIDKKLSQSNLKLEFLEQRYNKRIDTSSLEVIEAL